MLRLILFVPLLIPTLGYAQQYSKDDFAGMGISEGQAARIAERANESRNNQYSSSDFSGLDTSAGDGARVADRINEKNDLLDTWGSSIDKVKY